MVNDRPRSFTKRLQKNSIEKYQVLMMLFEPELMRNNRKLFCMFFNYYACINVANTVLKEFFTAEKNAEKTETILDKVNDYTSPVYETLIYVIPLLILSLFHTYIVLINLEYRYLCIKRKYFGKNLEKSKKNENENTQAEAEENKFNSLKENIYAFKLDIPSLKIFIACLQIYGFGFLITFQLHVLVKRLKFFKL